MNEADLGTCHPVALITGGAKRVGAAIARRLHGAGFDLAVHYRSSAEEALALQAELASQRADSVQIFQADLADLAATRALVPAVIAHFGLDGTAARPFDGLRFLDIGCGGGLLSEPMTRLGASVTGARGDRVLGAIYPA